VVKDTDLVSIERVSISRYVATSCASLRVHVSADGGRPLDACHRFPSAGTLRNPGPAVDEAVRSIFRQFTDTTQK
jgi:hypothetical protein